MSFTGGAAAVVGQVLNLLSQAQVQASGTAEEVVNSALANARVKPQRRNVTLAYTPPALRDLDISSDLDQFTVGDLNITEAAETAKIATKLASDFDNVLTDTFPVEYFTQGEAWITQALTRGEARLNVDVEDQAWMRGRTQLLREAGQADEATMQKWAAKGYTLPPGGMIHEMSLTERAAQDKIAELSRATGAEAFGRELDMVRDALQRAIELRKFAVGAAIDYMRAFMDARKFGLDVTKNIQAAHAKLNTATYDFYRNLQANRDWNVEVDRYNIAELNKREVAVDEIQMRAITAVVDALIKRFTALENSAASALNGMHGSAAISGNDRTEINL